MKFDGFDLDLAKIPKGFGIDPQDAGCADQEGGSTGTFSVAGVPWGTWTSAAAGVGSGAGVGSCD